MSGHQGPRRAVGSRSRVKRWPFTSKSSPSSAQTTSKAPFGVAVTSTRSGLDEQKGDSKITSGDPTGVSAARAGSGRRRVRRIRERER